MRVTLVRFALLTGVALGGACTADEAIKAGTDCKQECPVGAQMQVAKEASGSCGADGTYKELGEVSASGSCQGSGECQVVCKYPTCSDKQTLVISKDEFRCEAVTGCADVTCDGHGGCRIVNDAPVCDCDEGFISNGTHCDPAPVPVVSMVQPSTATVGVLATFTVVGEHLPDTLDVTLPDCSGLAFTVRGETAQVFTCTPTKEGVVARKVFDEPEGTMLFEDEATFTLTCDDCKIENKCWDDGDSNPTNPCQVCDSQKSKSDWTFDEGKSCSDDKYCNGEEVCDGVTETCKALSTPCQDDGLFCNGTEVCVEADDSCDHKDAPCQDDGLYCNGEEGCQEDTDTCLAPIDPCPQNLEFCDGVEICDEAADGCSTSGNPCPDNLQYCDGVESCNEVADLCEQTGDPCPDDLFCNGTESCDEQFDTCKHSGTPCPDDGLYCNGAEQCDEDGNSCFASPAWHGPCGLDQYCFEESDSCVSELVVSYTAAPVSHTPTFAVWPDGSMIVVWRIYAPFICDENYSCIVGRIFDASGVAQQDDYVGLLRISDYGKESLNPTVVAFPDGFAVAWDSMIPGAVYDDDTYSARLRRFDKSGVAKGASVPLASSFDTPLDNGKGFAWHPKMAPLWDETVTVVGSKGLDNHYTPAENYRVETVILDKLDAMLGTVWFAQGSTVNHSYATDGVVATNSTWQALYVWWELYDPDTNAVRPCIRAYHSIQGNNPDWPIDSNNPKFCLVDVPFFTDGVDASLDADGDATVVWKTGPKSSDTEQHVFMTEKLFQISQNKVGVQVSQEAGTNPSQPKVARMLGGDALVVWQADNHAADPQGKAVLGRWLPGSQVDESWPEFVLAYDPSGDEVSPDVEDIHCVASPDDVCLHLGATVVYVRNGVVYTRRVVSP